MCSTHLCFSSHDHLSRIATTVATPLSVKKKKWRRRSGENERERGIGRERETVRSVHPKEEDCVATDSERALTYEVPQEQIGWVVDACSKGLTKCLTKFRPIA